ncbi:amidohydrolase family protein [Propylenella binzhouense]|uniref:Amidohydrolase-related domain-containing protein n=1 Tax=Propylenella binzhouense TaxID=2555902 RepID=A0A964TAJ0_9HYPH|nr:amidohydrolase family protein [Propylenella binzhouense]MYZ50307.1 hypothetical protein [Propylenella binzhouense]
MQHAEPQPGARGIPDCLGPLAARTPPRFPVPPGAWDTHFHLFDPARAPYAPERKYSPPPARLPDYAALMQDLGLERAMLVHANLQGDDNRPLVEILAASEGRLAGVVRLPDEADAAELAAMHAAGVRGVRFAFNPQHGGVFDPILFERAEAICADRGWFIELHFAPRDLPALAPRLARARAPIVIDHMGRVDVAEGTEGAAFRLLAELAGHDHVWIKLSGADRLSREGPPYRDVVPIARALIAAAPRRMLWGTDWPHTGLFDTMPDDGALLNLLADFAPDAAVRDEILVANPLRLIGEG